MVGIEVAFCVDQPMQNITNQHMYVLIRKRNIFQVLSLGRYQKQILFTDTEGLQLKILNMPKVTHANEVIKNMRETKK